MLSEHELGREAERQIPREALEKNLAAGAIVPFRSAAFRPKARWPFARRKLRGSLHLPGLLLAGLLLCLGVDQPLQRLLVEAVRPI